MIQRFASKHLCLLVLLRCSFSSSLLVGPVRNGSDKISRLEFSFSRRDAFNVLVTSSMLPLLNPGVANSAVPLQECVMVLKEARKQLNPVPDLIKAQKWDSVRAILITPPLADCWAKTNRPLLKNYGDALSDVGGDEIAALDLREDIISHLRYLDMAVYNNVFNPINTLGEAGATKALIKSYYEDPINEWKASVNAFDEIIKLAEGL